MEFWWSWLVVGCLCGLNFGSILDRSRRQSDARWRSYQPGLGSSRGLGQSTSRLGSSRGNPWPQSVSGVGLPRGVPPVPGWGARYPGGGFQPRQLIRPAQPVSSPIRVQCAEDSMVVMVNRDFYGNGILLKPSDLSLGSCLPGFQGLGPNVVFNNSVQDCGSILHMTPEFLIYINTLSYNPVSSNSIVMRSSPATVPILCYYPRHGNVSSNAIKPTWAPFSTTVSTEERLSFSMYLMTDDFSAPRSSSVFQLGDLMYIEAWVNIENHLSMILFVDSCVATTMPDINSNPKYDIIAPSGCLVDGKQDDASSAFRSPRSEPNKIQFMVDAFRFIETDVSTIYITCTLRAVPANQKPDRMNKACSYKKATSSWLALEGSDDICYCCETGNCDGTVMQPRRWGPVHGGSRGIGKRETDEHKDLLEEQAMATLGPLLIISAEKNQQEAIAEQVHDSRSAEGSQTLELWMLVAICSVSVAVVAIALVVTGSYIVRKLSPREKV
ncbi:zona pellucida sperm-binding protein 3-like [Leptodactylus fuscus]|uniref:zona pellucida sperm-binding protein 3-like n=1 Tax=Leptodactylus fuscus TaxID=238119 RepID=UPI003F4E554B